jgi:ankyrin repeat protein
MDGILEYIKSNRDLELKDHWGKTALFWALRKGKYDIVNLLLASKANPNTTDENGISVFYQAVVSGEYNVADQLLASGANIDALNGNQSPETALHYCVMKNKPECVSYLLEQGANKSLKDSFGYTVFDRVKTHDHISKEIGQLLEK